MLIESIQVMEIVKEFHIDSAHYLPNLPKGHKCRRLHGHTWVVRVFVLGDIQNERGWVMDFAEIKSAVTPLLDKIDHRLLNDINGLENPTCENIARWIFKKLQKVLPDLSRIEVREGLGGGVSYAGD